MRPTNQTFPKFSGPSILGAVHSSAKEPRPKYSLCLRRENYRSNRPGESIVLLNSAKRFAGSVQFIKKISNLLPTTQKFHMATQTDNLEKYVAPKEQPVFNLDCKKAFESLSPQERKYAHYLTEGKFNPQILKDSASWAGCIICLIQTSEESPIIFDLFQVD